MTIDELDNLESYINYLNGVLTNKQHAYNNLKSLQQDLNKIDKNQQGFLEICFFEDHSGITKLDCTFHVEDCKELILMIRSILEDKYNKGLAALDGRILTLDEFIKVVT